MTRIYEYYPKKVNIFSFSVYIIIGYGELLLDKLTIQWPTENGHKDKRLHRKIKIEQHKRHKNI